MDVWRFDRSSPSCTSVERSAAFDGQTPGVPVPGGFAWGWGNPPKNGCLSSFTHHFQHHIFSLLGFWSHQLSSTLNSAGRRPCQTVSRPLEAKRVIPVVSLPDQSCRVTFCRWTPCCHTLSARPDRGPTTWVELESSWSWDFYETYVWLVVEPPLWKIWTSVGRCWEYYSQYMENMFQTTNQWYMTIYVDMYSHLPTSPVARRQNQYISIHKPYLWGELSKATVKRFSSRQAGLRLWSGLPVTKLWWKNTTSFVFHVKNRIIVLLFKYFQRSNSYLWFQHISWCLKPCFRWHCLNRAQCQHQWLCSPTARLNADGPTFPWKNEKSVTFHWS